MRFQSTVLALGGVAACSALAVDFDSKVRDADSVSLRSTAAADASPTLFNLTRIPVQGPFELASGVTANYSWGLLNLASSPYPANKNCASNGVRGYDCLTALSTAAIEAFKKTYVEKTPSRRNSRSVGYAQVEHPTLGLVTVSHIPITNGSLMLSSVSSGNNGTWAHQATTYDAAGDEVYHLMYRLAQPEDLGYDSNGTYHQYQMRLANPSSKAQRDRESGGGFVVDYVWDWL